MPEKTSEILNIIGHGVEIITVPSIKALAELEMENFEELCFTGIERSASISSANRIQHLAGRFAVKKAILTILGGECQKNRLWLDIEIRRVSTGEPLVILRKHCQNTAVVLGITKWLASISYTSSYAAASVIALGYRTRRQPTK